MRLREEERNNKRNVRGSDISTERLKLAFSGENEKLRRAGRDFNYIQIQCWILMITGKMWLVVVHEKASLLHSVSDSLRHSGTALLLAEIRGHRFLSGLQLKHKCAEAPSTALT